MGNSITLLNLGCGSIRPQNWINTDSSLNALLQKLPVLGNLIPSLLNRRAYDSKNFIYMNLNRKWNFSSDSIDVVYSSHTLEHLSKASARLMIKEAFRCLKRNGVIRLVVPDLYKLCKKYISEYEANSNISSSEQLLWALNLHREGQYGMNIPWFKKLVFEWQGYPHQHKYMYDFKSLYQLLHEQGFSAIQEKQYAQSDYISQILDVEGTVESYISVYLEARKC